MSALESLLLGEKHYDIVISDNLAAPLRYRPDSILMGSFLWSELLQAEPALQDWVRQEQELLARYLPRLLCCGPIAMDEIDRWTRPVRLNWMPWESRSAAGGANKSKGAPLKKIAIVSGKTGSAVAAHREILRALNAATDAELVVAADSPLTQESLPHLRPAADLEAEFDSCDWIVLRPGAGTVTEAIRTGTPMACLYEPGNLEMTHVARALEQKGLGIDFGSVWTPDKIRGMVARLLQDSLRDQIAEKIRKEPTDGLDQAVRFLEGLL